MMRKFTAGMELLAGALTPVTLMVNEPVVIALIDAKPLVAVAPAVVAVALTTGVRMIIEFGVTIEDVTACEITPAAAVAEFAAAVAEFAELVAKPDALDADAAAAAAEAGAALMFDMFAAAVLIAAIFVLLVFTEPILVETVATSPAIAATVVTSTAAIAAAGEPVASNVMTLLARTPTEGSVVVTPAGSDNGKLIELEIDSLSC
jgi:hypothetical protein